MPRDVEQLAKQVLVLHSIGRPLMEDTIRALGELKKCHDRGLRRGSVDLREFSFWAKVTVSCFFAHVTAVASIMRKNVQLFHSFSDVTPTAREIAKLVGRRYDKDADDVSRQWTRPLSTTDSLKLGFRLFARQIGAEFSLNTGDGRFRGLVNLQTARRRFTHPERIEDLYAPGMVGNLQSSLAWFYSEFQRFIHAAQAALGVAGLPTAAEEPKGKPLKPVDIDERQLFTDEELNDQIVLGGRTLSYIKHFFRVLRYDGTRAAKMRKRAGNKDNALGQFARRVILRVHATQLEALSNAVWFLLDSARTMREVEFRDSDLEPEADLPAKLGLLVARVNVWSSRTGSGQKISLDDGAKNQLAAAWKKRDKLVHPLLPKDIEFKRLDALRAALALYDLECKALECMWVDPDRLQAAYERGLATRGENIPPLAPGAS